LTDPPDRSDLDVLFSADEIMSRVRAMADEIRSDVPDATELCVVGVLKGGFVFLADLIRELELPVTVCFIGASSYGGNTRPGDEVRIEPALTGSVEGRDVLIVEDIVDTGRTVRVLRSHIEQRNPASIRVCTMFLKPDRLEVPVEPDYTGLEVPDRFVVGYGLDYDELFRELPYLAALPRRED